MMQLWGIYCQGKFPTACCPMIAAVCSGEGVKMGSWVLTGFVQPTENFVQKLFQFKGELGVNQFYFRKIPWMNKKFWWFRFFLFRLGADKFEKMSKMKLLSAV